MKVKWAIIIQVRVDSLERQMAKFILHTSYFIIVNRVGMRMSNEEGSDAAIGASLGANIA